MDQVMKGSGKRLAQVVDRLPNHDKPMNKNELGNATWPLLHRMSLSYPEKPTNEQKERMKTLLHSFSWLYPCSHCADDLRQKMKEFPPQVESREELAMWLCM